MITPFQVGILIFLGILSLVGIILIFKILPLIRRSRVILEKYGEVYKHTTDIQKSTKAVIDEANRRAKSAEDHVLELKGKLVSAQENEKRAIKAKEDYVRIIKEDKVLYPNYSLVWTEQKEEFTVNYECDVLEVSEKKAKIRPYAASSSNKRWNDLSDEDKNDPRGTFRHVYERWVPLEKLELIIDLGRN